MNCDDPDLEPFESNLRATIQSNISCTVPSYGEVWWIVQMYKFLQVTKFKLPKPQDFMDRHKEEYNQLTHLCPTLVEDVQYQTGQTLR